MITEAEQVYAPAARRALVAFGVDQNHFQRRVLKHPVEAFGVDKTHRQQQGVKTHRDGERPLQGAELFEEGQKRFHARIIRATSGSAGCGRRSRAFFA